MSKRILSVSYNENLLITRRMLLEREGYHVTSALGFAESANHCKTGKFSLFILGHSIPDRDKEELIKMFRESNPAPVLSLKRDGEKDVKSAEHHVSPHDPAEFMRVVARIMDGHPSS